MSSTASFPAESRPRVPRPWARPWRLARRLGRVLSVVLPLLWNRRALAESPSGLLTRLSESFCAIHELEVRVHGMLPEGPKLIVMNHLGYVDPLVLAKATPIRAIAKSEVGAWPFVGALGRAAGVSFVRRGCPRSGFRVLREVRRTFDAGGSVLNFAEGTTSIGDDVLPFHRGTFGVARHAGVKVVPVRLRFERRSLAWIDDEAFLPHYLRFISGPGETVHLEVLESIDPAEHASAESLAAATRAALRVRVRG